MAQGTYRSLLTLYCSLTPCLNKAFSIDFMIQEIDMTLHNSEIEVLSLVLELLEYFGFVIDPLMQLALRFVHRTIQ